MLSKVTALNHRIPSMISYTDLILLKTFYERLEVLKCPSKPSELTFDELRYLNQRFYQSDQWKRVRNYVIARDSGNDLGIPGREIYGPIIVHHMNPIRPKDLLFNYDALVDPEFLITVSDPTHRSIHFNSPITEPRRERYLGDTKLW